MSETLLVRKVTNNAIIPKRGSKYAVGYDLHAIAKYEIFPNKQAIIGTGLAFSIPLGYYGRVAPRSGMSWKKHSDVGAGVIDPDYRGEVKVILRNLSSTEPILINEGDRVAQLILEKCSTPDIVEVESLEDTMRGEGGFGSTGV